MLFLINILIQDTELDLIFLHFFQLQNWSKNVIIFGVDMSLSVHANNKNKDILIIGKGNYQLL